MRRALCPVETLYVGQRSRAVLFCAVRGRVDAAALSSAFDAVVAEHPSLRARIAADGSAPDASSAPGHVLEPLDEGERPRLVLRTGADAAYDEELNTPLPVGGPLTRAVLATDPDGARHVFSLSVDHVITDGHSSIALQNAIWDRYRALVEGGDAAAPPRPWPVPISELLPPADPAETADYLRRRLAETRDRPAELVPYDAAPADGHRIEVRRLLLDEAHTERLRRVARDQEVSVHGLVGSALLAAARARLDGDGPRVLGCLSPVDLRSRLSPPVPPDVMAAAVTTHLHALPVDADSDPLVLARELSADLRAAIDGGEHFQDMRITPHIPENPALQRATVIATNMGVVPGPRLPAGAEVTDVRLMPAREHYFPQAGRSPLMACVVSFDGRLSIELPHHTACFTPAFMRGFRDDVRSALLSFAPSHDDQSVAGSTA